MILKKFPFERQLDSMDCGPACLKIIAKYFGKYYSLQYLRDLCGITREGVSFLDLSYGAEKIGLHTLAVKADLKTLRDKVPFPCIVHWKNSHFIVVYKTSKQKIFVSDPARGLLGYSYNEFKDGWYKKEEETGAILAVEPDVQNYFSNDYGSWHPINIGDNTKMRILVDTSNDLSGFLHYLRNGSY